MLKPHRNEVRKPIKTISGVAPIAVMLPPRKCRHGSCIYCPNFDVPQSYTPKSPVVLRAVDANYSSYKQVKGRLEAFKAMNHPTEKIELIIMGGTFLHYPKKFQYKFIKECYDALNGKKSKSLKEAKKLNESSKHRCVALCIETRPDACIEFIDRMREFGCTRVELGVQIIDDSVYELINRGHSVKDVAEATEALKNAGFKVGYHIMPGLPGSNPSKDLKLFKKLFSDERFKPDQLKIYPCQVMPCSELENWYFKDKYAPYTEQQIKDLLVSMLKIVPRYCRVMRIMREIPPEYITAGTIRIDLRNEIEKILKSEKINLKEIRYREAGFALREHGKINLNLRLKTTKYKASNGKEYFLEVVNKQNILFGLLRLRIFKHNAGKKQIKKAFIRELHVYGMALKLGKKNQKAVQHKGIGKWLMIEAEKIAKKAGVNTLRVISGVGAREYFRKLGYELGIKEKGEYMIKRITKRFLNSEGNFCD